MKGRLPTVGWGPFCFQWYSLCSGHSLNADGNYYEFDEDCPRCLVGEWINCWKHKAESFVYEYDPELWRWWANRPVLVSAAKQLLLKALKTKMRDE